MSQDDFRGRGRLDRRDFLSCAGMAALAVAPLGSLCARTSQRRSLSFVHTHTGESLSAAYFADGAYQPASLERLNYLLRDFRTGDMHPIDPTVLDILFDLQALANRDAPYQVICGYRSPRTNAALRRRSRAVAEHSLHMEGRAIDVRLEGFSTSKLHQLALGMQRGGVGFYPGADFIHLDNGPVRFW